MSRHSTGQTGEYLVAAELARHGFTVAVPTGNAPAIDLLAYKDGHSFPIQVKAVATGSHQFNLAKFVDVECFEDGRQVVNGPLPSLDRKIALALVFVGARAGEDEILWGTVGDLADLLAAHHGRYLERHGGRRPGRNPQSLHAALSRDVFTAALGHNSLLDVLAN